MQIKSLSHLPLQTIIDCLLDSFSDYMVPMPSELDYWKYRFKSARVDFDLSFGVFDEEKLVAFIIHGVDIRNGKKTAFNTGTGVISRYRGKQLVDQIYHHAFPILIGNGISTCMLEVIQTNPRAIRVYERIGFHSLRELICFKGELKINPVPVTINPISFEERLLIKNPNQHFYSWDHCNEAILASEDTFQTYEVIHPDGQPVGYFTINPENGYLPQFESEPEHFMHLMSGIAQVCQVIKINNIDSRRKDVLKNLLTVGMEHTVDQFEMEMGI